MTDQSWVIQTFPKNQQRISGTDKTWSAREIYPLPTSDSRSADYVALGNNNAWIKLAEPTAEAIRQAFLGHESRISIEQPQVPSLLVAGVSVAGSTILRDTCVALSPEFNSVIGGRGSGKSSLLEYLSFGLGRSCYDVSRDHYSGADRLRGLLGDTLISKSGSVKLTIVQDGAPFVVERAQATAYQPQVTYPNGDRQAVTVKELRALFPAVVYSQGELAEIGKQTGEKTKLADLLQFVNPDYKREDDRLLQDIEAAKGAVKQSIQKLVSYWTLKAKLRRLKTSRNSIVQRVQALEKTLPKQSEEDQEVIAFFEKANEFDLKRIQASKHTSQILDEIKAFEEEHLYERDLKCELTGTSEVVTQAYTDFYEFFNRGIRKLHDDLMARRKALTTAEIEWTEQFKVARKERDAVLEKLSEHRTVTGQIIKLREEITDLTNQAGDLDAQLMAAGDPASGLQQAVNTLNEKNSQRTQRTQEWSAELEALSSGKIKAAVDPDGDNSEIFEAMDTVASKTGSQEATRLRTL